MKHTFMSMPHLYLNFTTYGIFYC